MLPLEVLTDKLNKRCFTLQRLTDVNRTLLYEPLALTSFSILERFDYNSPFNHTSFGLRDGKDSESVYQVKFSLIL